MWSAPTVCARRPPEMRQVRTCSANAWGGIFSSSITLELKRTRPKCRSKYAGNFDIKPGWSFLTGVCDVDPALPGPWDWDPARTGIFQPLGMARYGNDKLDVGVVLLDAAATASTSGPKGGGIASTQAAGGMVTATGRVRRRLQSDQGEVQWMCRTDWHAGKTGHLRVAAVHMVNTGAAGSRRTGWNRRTARAMGRPSSTRRRRRAQRARRGRSGKNCRASAGGRHCAAEGLPHGTVSLPRAAAEQARLRTVRPWRHVPCGSGCHSRRCASV